MSTNEQKPVISEPKKSSIEILSELFGTFDAEPPLLIKKEKDESKKHKKSKKKHKHKDKKHKKKEKKKKRNESGSSTHSEVDLAALLIKQERQSPEKKIKLEADFVNKIKTEKLVQEDISNITDDKNENGESVTKTNNNSSKIIIKNLKFSSIFEASIEQIKKKVKDHEDGEISSSDKSTDEENKSKQTKSKRKHKHSHDDKSKKRKHSHHKKEKIDEDLSTKKVSKGKSPIRFYKEEDKFRDDNKHRDKYKIDSHKHSKERDDHKHKDKQKDDHYKEREDYKSKHKESHYKDKERGHRSHSHEDYKHKHKESSTHKEDDYSRIKDERDRKWFMRDRYRGYDETDKERERRYRDRSNSRDRDSHIDKKKLLEIARRNAIQMMKSGSLPAALTLGPQAQEKVLAAIKAGGKTIEELTDFCKSLSKKEELGELSSVSGDDDSDPETKAFHHPFQLKDRPTAIVMNIKNSVPLPTKTAQERNVELRIQFPVSSGTQHRKTENEWVPVSPKKRETSPVIATQPKPVTSNVTPDLPSGQLLAIEAAPEPSPPGPQVFPNPSDVSCSMFALTDNQNLQFQPNIDIGSIVSQRLTAMRKLQEDPHDVEALNEMHKSQMKMQTWAESKQQPGQFTGSTGANILTQAELAAGYQAWARKDQLQNAAPVSGGMGMHLLKKMGWNPGEGLGKEKTGTLEPLLLEVKLDKKGLVANEEQKRRQQKAQRFTVKTLEGKHPVSLLGEFTAKRKLGAPEYTLCLESGPDHKKMFLFKVIVNGTEYQPDAASPNKKQAKADAARLCLQKLGLLPNVPKTS